LVFLTYLARPSAFRLQDLLLHKLSLKTPETNFWIKLTPNGLSVGGFYFMNKINSRKKMKFYLKSTSRKGIINKTLIDRLQILWRESDES